MCQLHGSRKRIFSAIAPTKAFKIFEVHRYSSLNESSVTLRSMFKGGVAWYSGVKTTALCTDWHCHKHSYKDERHAWSPYDCQGSYAGIYAFDTAIHAREEMEETVKQYYVARPKWEIYEVELSGEIEVYSNGYRAQYCTIIQKYHPSRYSRIKFWISQKIKSLFLL